MRSVWIRWLSLPAGVGAAALLGSLATGCACRPESSWCSGNTRFACEGGGRADGSEDPFGRAASDEECAVACVESGGRGFCSLSAEPVTACQRLRPAISVCWNNHVLRQCRGERHDYPDPNWADDCGSQVCVETGTGAICTTP